MTIKRHTSFAVNSIGIMPAYSARVTSSGHRESSWISTLSRLVEQLFHAPFGLVSHGMEADPIFNFGNAAALKLFETSWEAFTRLPSRESAEPISRKERAVLLERVSTEGFIDDYRGVRISASGRRFRIEQATVWNLVDASGRPWGQAAKLDRWSYL